MIRLLFALNAAVLAAFAPNAVLAEVDFPLTRAAVNSGELYELGVSGEWSSHCLRDANSEDYCFTERRIVILDKALDLRFAIYPYDFPVHASNLDVDLAPRASIEIYSPSNAPHYANYSSAITQVDGKPFDAYWCDLAVKKSLTNVRSWLGSPTCHRGDEVNSDDLQILSSAKQATITIYDKSSPIETPAAVVEIEVDLSGMNEEFSRAQMLNSDIYGVDLARFEFPYEMCDFKDEQGRQRRISYSFDRDNNAKRTSRSEKLFGPKTGGSCPGYVALAFYTPDLTNKQREGFCLLYDDKTKNVVGFQQGAQNAYGVCQTPARSFCERVNAAKGVALGIAGTATGILGASIGTSAGMTAAGVSVVSHSSGAAILTGSSGYIAGTLGTYASVLGAVSSPLVATASTTVAVIAVPAVTGAVYVCWETEAEAVAD